MTYKFACLNNISPIGLKRFTNRYEQVSEIEEANGILVRSASMHDMEFSDSLYAIARAGAGVNNIPLKKCAALRNSYLPECSWLPGTLSEV